MSSEEIDSVALIRDMMVLRDYLETHIKGTGKIAYELLPRGGISIRYVTGLALLGETLTLSHPSYAAESYAIDGIPVPSKPPFDVTLRDVAIWAASNEPVRVASTSHEFGERNYRLTVSLVMSDEMQTYTWVVH